MLFELHLRWDLEAAREIFQDDALIVAAFVVSTVSMILLGFFLRQFVAVRTLLEAPLEMQGASARLHARDTW